MSGVGGWHKAEGTHSSYDVETNARPRNFEAARRAYEGGVAKETRLHHIPVEVSKSAYAPAVITPVVRCGAKHSLKTSAPNVLIGIHDVTRSMDKIPEENFKRLPLLYRDEKKYLGQNQELDAVFIAYGDAFVDTHSLQVPARFERGEALDGQLASLYIEGGGGPGRRESAELAAYFLLKKVDVSGVQNCHTFFMTDEKGYDTIDGDQVKKYLGCELDVRFEDTAAVFRALKQKMKIFVILYHTDARDALEIKAWWEKMVGAQNVITLQDERRTVDVILGASASTVGKSELFTTDLKSRHMGSRYETINVSIVLDSVSKIISPEGGLAPLRVIPPGRKSILLLEENKKDSDSKI